MNDSVTNKSFSQTAKGGCRKPLFTNGTWSILLTLLVTLYFSLFYMMISQKMEQEFSVAMSKLQHDQREVDNRLISLEKAELELKAEHNSNISCLLELMR